MWKILIYYVLLMIPVFRTGKGQKKMFWGCFSVALVVLLIPIPKETRIHCLDVGQGECILVQTRDRRAYLFDGGSSSRRDVGEKVILPFLQYYGIGKLNGVFLSHGDTDHVNGILQLIQAEKVEVENVYLPKGQESPVKEICKTMGITEGMKIQTVQKGDVWTNGEFSLYCLHPSRDFQGEDNDSSACYLFQAKDFRMLFTGDVEATGEQKLLEELEKQNINSVDVLKVAHHGSASSTSKELLRKIQPKLAIISCGRKNSYGHPHIETMERLEEAGCIIMTTPRYGRITINIEEKSAWGY